MNNLISIIQSHLSHCSRNFGRRGVAPVIATLLLVAIAVVGGSIIFVFSQGFFATAQISGSPQIESVKILGYDATDGNSTQYHDGFITNSTVTGADDSNGLRSEEYIAVYLKNDSVNKVTLSEIRLAGYVYLYVDLGGANLPDFDNGSGLANEGEREFTLIKQGYDGINSGITIDAAAPELQPGQQVTVILALDKDFKSGRDLQFRISTIGGAVFVSTVNSGQQIG